MSALVVGDRVRLKAGDGAVATIERLGIHPKVYRVVPPLNGAYWHIRIDLEKLL